MRIDSIGLTGVAVLAAAFSGGSELTVHIQVANHGGYANFKDATFTARQGAHVIKVPLDLNGRATAVVSAGAWEVACEGPNVHCPKIARTLRDKELKLDGFGLSAVTAAPNNDLAAVPRKPGRKNPVAPATAVSTKSICLKSPPLR